MAPLISIIIPCYNAAPWLAASLDSAFAQTWQTCEIILVDDGSIDDSLAIALRYETRGLRIVMQTNRGAAAARNAGLRIAQGDYIQFLDADDVLAPDKLEHQMARVLKTDRLTAFTGKWARFDTNIDLANFRRELLCIDANPIDWLVTKLETNAMMHPAAWLISRRLADLVGPWDERLTLDDDGEYFTRVVLHARGLCYCSEAISYYRSGLPGSLSHSKSEKAFASALLAIELSTDRLLQAENTARTRHAAASALQRFVYESYPYASKGRKRASLRVRELGGTNLKPEGGGRFQLARRLIGWRLAKRLCLQSR